MIIISPARTRRERPTALFGPHPPCLASCRRINNVYVRIGMYACILCMDVCLYVYMYICVYTCIDRMRPFVYLRSLCQTRAWVCIRVPCVRVCAVARVCLISSGSNYVSLPPYPPTLRSFSFPPRSLFASFSSPSPAGKLSETVSSLTCARRSYSRPVRRGRCISFSCFTFPAASFRLLLTFSSSPHFLSHFSP